MNTRTLSILVALVLFAAGAWALLRPAPQATQVAAEPPPAERQPLYWYDPMKPELHFAKPGKSPFMDMELVAKYATPGDGGVVIVDPRMVQQLGIRTAVVRRGALGGGLAAVGMVGVDERRLYAVTSRAGGWVERLAVHAVGDPVARGAPLAGVYAPELLAAQEELLLAKRSGDAALQGAARERLSLLGMGDAEVASVLASGTTHRQMTLVAPVDGVVVALDAREGQQVAADAPLFRIADLATVWILVEVPEAQAGALRAGASAIARLAALPGEAFTGRIDRVYPELQTTTRTVRARLAFDNPGLRLKPGMSADVTLAGDASHAALLVPSAAVIRTGTRSVVILAEGEGRFRPAEVEVGDDRGGDTEVLRGLDAGETVVVSGQFLIDSEANLRGALARLAAPSAAEGGR